MRRPLRHWRSTALTSAAPRPLLQAAGLLRCWWRRRESNPRPEPPRTGVYACSRRSVFVARLARRPACLTLRRLSSRLGVDVRTLRPAHFRTFAPASHGRGFRGTLAAVKQPERSYGCQLMALQLGDAASCVRDAQPRPRNDPVETVSPPRRPHGRASSERTVARQPYASRLACSDYTRACRLPYVCEESRSASRWCSPTTTWTSRSSGARCTP